MAPLVASIVSLLVSKGLPQVAKVVTEKGLEYVEEKTGIKLEPDMQDEKIAELRIAAMQHEEFKMQQEFKNKELEQSNVKDARDLQKVALGQDDLFSKRFLYYFAMFWSAFASIYIVCITFFPIPTDSLRFADTILRVFTWYFNCYNY